MVEHTAVNRGVVGSSPTRGAENPVALVLQDFFINKSEAKKYQTYLRNALKMHLPRPHTNA